MARHLQLARTLAGTCAVGFLLASCGYVPEQAAATPEPQSVRGIFSAEQLGIQLDENGRPYDTHWIEHWPEGGVERAILQNWSIPDGEILVMDGNVIELSPSSGREWATVVDFDTDDLQLFVHWGLYENLEEGGFYRYATGLEVRVPDKQVETWGATEFGFSTDGGVGGLVTARAADLDGVGSFPFIPEEDITYETSVQIFDVIGDEGTDAVIFSLGSDGSAPLVRGYDADGAMVSAVIFDYTFPWRLMIEEGTPPPDLSALEVQYGECMSGERDVILSDRFGAGTTGYCDIDFDALPTVDS